MLLRNLKQQQCLKEKEEKVVVAKIVQKDTSDFDMFLLKAKIEQLELDKRRLEHRRLSEVQMAEKLAQNRLEQRMIAEQQKEIDQEYELSISDKRDESSTSDTDDEKKEEIRQRIESNNKKIKEIKKCRKEDLKKERISAMSQGRTPNRPARQTTIKKIPSLSRKMSQKLTKQASLKRGSKLDLPVSN